MKLSLVLFVFITVNILETLCSKDVLPYIKRLTENSILPHQSSVLFEFVSNLFINELTTRNFNKYFSDFQDFFYTYVFRDQNQLKVILTAYITVRNRLNLYKEKIDEGVFELIRVTLNYPITIRPWKIIKEDIFIYYVGKIPKLDRKKFSGYYIDIEQQYFSVTHHFYIGSFKIILYHRDLNEEKKSAIEEESYIVYKNFITFWKRIKLDYVCEVKDINIYIFSTKQQYRRIGIYFNKSVNNGGISSFHKKKIQASVYYEMSDDRIPNAFGHELFHCFTFSTNRRVLHKQNHYEWFVEGSANYLGLKKCQAHNYYGLLNFRHLKIPQILKAGYEDSALYPMGTVLFSFLYNFKPSILRSMIVKQNYNFTPSAYIITEFEKYKKKLGNWCKDNLVNNRNLVQEQYLSVITNDIFLSCPTILIQIEKGPVYFLNNISLRSDSQINQKDFEIFQKTIINIAAKKLLYKSADMLFPINYSGSAFCAIDKKPLSKKSIKKLAERFISKTETILNFADHSVLKDIKKKTKSCNNFINPISLNVNKTLIQKIYSRNLKNKDLTQVITPQKNTVLHMVGMHDPQYFMQLIKTNLKLAISLFNRNCQTPLDFYFNTLNYIKKFGHIPFEHCYNMLIFKPLCKNFKNTAATHNILSISLIFIWIQYMITKYD
jgi:hypothetical protein